ncbi:Plasmid pRiA4b ORF-3-like protein [Peribacillus asahii]|uniref:Plasmid pRiA4b ORF-3-like protein n=1 Tax=Peribacillus asahii TaxID=228899 RepID=A0A3Q9RRX3_9BACI|nr:plasmid pRiA4b ORF-3 family protein [Peribacillus asahii]AZV45264.1 Plasmid pRiA4b ORF-3-like protein [Peribacillus asahii]
MKAYQLLITLNHVEPAVWRRVIIPAETHFKRLHDTIQFAMGLAGLSSL